MNRFLALLATLVLLLTLAMGSVAHAAEPQGVSAADTPATVAQAVSGHASGDSDQVPADADTRSSHHHGGCHGDHLAAPYERAHAALAGDIRTAPYRAVVVVRPRSTADPTLRPPRV